MNGRNHIHADIVCKDNIQFSNKDSYTTGESCYLIKPSCMSPYSFKGFPYNEIHS